MLTFFAAAVPICASLLVAGLALTEQRRLAWERQIRYRVGLWTWEYLEDRHREARSHGNFGAAKKAADEFEARMLSHYGITNARPTYLDADTDIAMSAPLVSRTEKGRQWLLLIGSAAGVVLLAFDAMGH